MATTNRGYIFAAFILSAIAASFNLVSLSTEEWITGKAILMNSSISSDFNQVNYGLFQGNYKRNFPSSTSYQLTITCSFKNNICALLCGLDAEDREDLLNDLYNNESDPSYAFQNCTGITIYSVFSWPVPITRNYAMNYDTSITSVHRRFINAGVWLSTIMFLILASLIGGAASVLALYNTVTNPIQYYFSVTSLFFYNGLAFSCTIIYMVLWGTVYILRIFHNVSIYDTIEGSITSDKMAYLGWSYWISLIPLMFYTGSIGLLYYREYLNAKYPKQVVTLDSDNADANLYLY